MTSVDDYISNMRKIMVDTRAQMQKDVEFIVLNCFLPNPLSAQDTGYQKAYRQPLQELCDSIEGCVMVDFSQSQIEFMENKFYADMLSNNINHPNDFYVRVDAMHLLATLINY